MLIKGSIDSFWYSLTLAIFQKTLNIILQGIPQVICFIDDTLVTGADDEGQLRNLAEVLRRLNLRQGYT